MKPYLVGLAIATATVCSLPAQSQPSVAPAADTAIAAASPAPAAMTARSAQLTGMDKIDYNALILRAQEARQTTDLAQQKTVFKQFMDESRAFLQKHPEQTLIWQLRAASALGLNDIVAGFEAGQKLLAAGAADSDDPNLRQLMAQLKNKGWLDEPTVKEALNYTAGKNHAVTLPNAVTLDLIWIAPGTFTMGSPDSETGRAKDEGPQTTVTINQGFWLGKTPVTQGQYQAIMNHNPSHFANAGANAPVERVSWDDAMEFCRKLTEQERAAGHLPQGYAYTLPTEAQWEYACRAGTTEARYSSYDIAWHAGNGGGTTHPVAQNQPNAWGLCDMNGNVSEWCSDWYGPYPGGNVTDPVGASSGSVRVVRGGSWNLSADYCRSACRLWFVPGVRSSGLGFRLALSSVRLDQAVPSVKPADVAAPGSKLPASSVVQPAVTATSTQLEAWAAGQSHAVTLPTAVTLDLIWIAPGTFTMGSPDSEGGNSNDQPAPMVLISKGFWLGKTLVTQGQYQAVMGTNPSHFANIGADAPVETVSWDDAMEFCHKLTKQERAAGHLPEGYAYTLPTEAQWEYACKAGTTGEQYDHLDDMAWYEDNSGNSTHPVGQKQPNAWGLYDMLGNVSEWCLDWRSELYGPYPGANVTDPVGASSGTDRVVRGGSWFDSAAYDRSAFRHWLDPEFRNCYLGFRLALAPSHESEEKALNESLN